MQSTDGQCCQNACKRRLRRTASGDCATPSERSNASQDEAEKTKNMQAPTAANGKRRLRHAERTM